MNATAKMISEQLIKADSSSLSDAWETLCVMSGEDAAKTLLEVFCSADRIVDDSEISEFAIRVGAIADA